MRVVGASANLLRNDKGTFVRTRTIWTPECWDNGYIDNKGRFRVYRPDCPRAFKSGYALRAHVVWWLHHGQCHDKSEDLHHKDHNRLNDSIGNLEAKLRAEHMRHHHAKPLAIVICDGCCQEFYVPPWRIRQRVTRFCSQACYQKSPRSQQHKDNIAAGNKRSWQSGGARRKVQPCMYALQAHQALSLPILSMSSLLEVTPSSA